MLIFLFFNLIVTITGIQSDNPKSNILNLLTKDNQGNKYFTWNGIGCRYLPHDRNLLDYSFVPYCENCCVKFYLHDKNCNEKSTYVTVTSKGDSSITNTKGTYPIDKNTWWSLDQVKSYGPCEKVCKQTLHDVKATEEPSFNVTLFKEIKDDHFHGHHETLEIKGCTVISKSLRRQVSSLKIADGSICIELHSKWNCTGLIVQIPNPSRNSYSINSLQDWNFDDQPAAISSCNYNCTRKTTESNIKFIQPDQNIVTLFSNPGFKGVHHHLNLSKGCFNLTKDWESIQTYGLCVKVYEASRCDRSNPHFRLIQPEADLYSWNITAGIRSIVSCDYASKHFEVDFSGHVGEESSIITIYNEPNFKGEKMDLHVANCIYPLPHNFQLRIASVKIKDNCINLYNESRCTGNDYIIVKTDILNLTTNGKDYYVQSIGPCYERCHPYNVDNTISTNSWAHQVTFYQNHIKKELSLWGGSCVEIPNPIRNKAFQILMRKQHCYELYENNKNCTGPSIQIRKHVIGKPDLYPYDRKYVEKAASISFCGYNCLLVSNTFGNSLNSDKLPARVNHTASDKDIVTIFPQPNFNDKYGYKKLNLANGCVNINKELQNAIGSIYTYGRCVNLYEDLGCSSKLGRNITVQNLQSHSNSNILIRSMQFCAKIVRNDKPLPTLGRREDTIGTTSTTEKTSFSTTTAQRSTSSTTLTENISSITVEKSTSSSNTMKITSSSNTMKKITSSSNTMKKNTSSSITAKNTTIFRTADISALLNSPNSTENSTAPSSFNGNAPLNLQLILVITAIGMVLLVSGITLVVIIKRRNKARDLNAHIEIEARPKNGGAIYKTYKISKNSVFIDKNSILALSEFAIVFKGQVQYPKIKNECKKDVAIKKLKPIHEVSPDAAEYLQEMLNEIKTMIRVGEHYSVLGFIGFCTNRGKLLIITELCLLGPLEKFIQAHCKYFENYEDNQNQQIQANPTLCNELTGINIDDEKPLNSTLLWNWSFEIADGMEYLAVKNVIHSDLTTKNVLLNSELSIKICGFGISKLKYTFKQCVKKAQGPSSWRSMAIETLRDLEFSIESDVWAYGVVLWEIFSLGDVPYPEKEWGVSFITELSNGMRLPQPKYAPSEIYTLMNKCWWEIPLGRISFTSLKSELSTLNQVSSPELKDTDGQNRNS